MRKNRTFGKLILASLAAQLLVAAPIQASSKDQLHEQKIEKQSNISELETYIADKLLHINEKKTEVDELYAQIEAINIEKEQTQLDIDRSKEQISDRKGQLEERLLALQTSSTSTNRILMIFESESFTDFIGRILLVGQLQAADNERIVAAIEEEAELKQLEKKLVDEVTLVTEKTTQVEEEAVALSDELSELQAVLSENQAELGEILTAEKEIEVEEAKLAEEARLTEEARLAEAERVEAIVEETETISYSEPQQSKTEVVPVENKKTEPKVEAPAPVTKGRQMVVSATAYSRHEAGLTNFTRMGIDLRINPMVIAVDPNVIPLGTLLDVPGYGIAIAGDTGGAIIGNKIDLHIEDMATMNAFGRQQMTITILD